MKLTDKLHNTKQDAHLLLCTISQSGNKVGSRSSQKMKSVAPGPELLRHIARHWPSCSVAQTQEKKPENKKVEKPLLPITLSYSALHTPLWYKERQLQQKLTLSLGNQTTKASER